MKLNKSSLYIILYFVMFFVHLVIWKVLEKPEEDIFFKYYIFLSFLFIMPITILTIVKRIYPEYVGFAFMGLLMFKLAMMFMILNKLHFSNVPNYKFHFIPPYLFSLVLETLYAIKLVKDEKNH